MNPFVLKGLLAFNTTTSIFFYIYGNTNNEILKGFFELHSLTYEKIKKLEEHNQLK